MKKFKNDNRGSTLLIVIVCMLFVGIIGAMMLQVTLTNRKMKTVENLAKENFYTTETALDELKSGLQELASAAMSDSYQSLLTEYTFVSDSDRPAKFKGDFVAGLYAALQGIFGDAAAFESNGMNFFKTTDVGELRWLKRPQVIPDVAEGNVRLKDVSLAYKDEYGYETYITTDIVITAEYPEFMASYRNESSDEFIDYGIITDQCLRNTLNGHAFVNSNIYAGGCEAATRKYTGHGVYTHDGILDIFADKIITRTSVDVNGNGRINISGLTVADNLAEVWTRNMSVGQSKNPTTEVNLNINGKCYVADDLSLDTDGSNVVIRGEYYGYSTNNISASNRNGDAQSSSAITINAPAVTLDLTALDTLWLSGKSYIAANDSYGIGVQGAVAAELVEGESLTYKNLQTAYLLPGDCIIGIGHNPMTVEEYGRLTNESLSTVCYIDLLQSQKNGGVRLGDYLKKAEPYRQVFVRYIDNTMVYLYMNFQNPDKASEYFVKYNEIYDDVTLLGMQSLYDASTNRGSILINPASLTNTGNVITYSESDGYRLYERNRNYNNTDTENVAMQLAAKYNGLSLALDENYTAMGGIPYLTDRIIDYTKLPGYPGALSTVRVKLQEDISDGYYCITGDDIVIENMTKAIVIATGDVTLKSAFTGSIIAKGDIILEGNASVNSDPAGIRKLFANEERLASVEAVKKYFRIFNTEPGMAGSNTSGASSIYITFENWRKN